jgi:hypothetical protein
MSLRKKITIKARDTGIHKKLVQELSKRPELADYDMDSIEISIKKKYQPYIQDVDSIIKNLQHYYAANKEYIETVNGKQIIFKKDIAKMMKISRPTLDKWLKNGFVSPSRIPNTPFECFQIDEVIEQLRKQKQ